MGNASSRPQGTFTIGWVNTCYHWLQIKVPNSHILKVKNNWYNNQTNGKQVFTFQYRDTLVSDNGPQLTSNDFEFYLQTHNIKHQLTSPYWPQVNSEVERFNRIITKTIKRALTEGKDWKEALQQFLLMYHTIPHNTTTAISPAQVLFHHITNNCLPTIQLRKWIVNNRETNYREQNK